MEEVSDCLQCKHESIISSGNGEATFVKHGRAQREAGATPDCSEMLP